MALHCREFRPESDTAFLYDIFSHAKDPEQLGIPFPINSDEMFVQWLIPRLKNFYHIFYVVVDAHDSAVGVLYSYNYRQADASCWVRLYLPHKSYAPEEIIILDDFTKDLFRQYPLHKIFFEMLASEDLAKQLISVGRPPECVLKEHSFSEGNYQDLMIWGVKRNDMEL